MLIAAVPKETYPGERRVAAVPATIPLLTKAGLEVRLEAGAGEQAGFPDAQYERRGAKTVGNRDELFAEAQLILQVRCLGANPEAGRSDLGRLKSGQIVIGMCDPLGAAEATKELAPIGVSVFALELMPRISRAQSMDVLSSMATVAGYKAVLLAADHLPKMFPMMMTAAGTIKPAKVFVIGAGVAGLQAIASARRLGAIVQGYDIRPAVREQVESLGAKFVEMELETSGAEGAGGYAKAMDEEFYRRQRELMASVVAESDVCITTAAIPGKPSPLLVTADAVRKMQPGSVIVDLAAERGGNCELSEADRKVVEQGVTILGPTNLPSEVPYHASQMYARNVATFVGQLVKEGRFELNLEDEVHRETLVTHEGDVVHSRLREMLGMAPKAADSSAEAAGGETEQPPVKGPGVESVGAESDTSEWTPAGATPEESPQKETPQKETPQEEPEKTEASAGAAEEATSPDDTVPWPLPGDAAAAEGQAARSEQREEEREEESEAERQRQAEEERAESGPTAPPSPDEEEKPPGPESPPA